MRSWKRAVAQAPRYLFAALCWAACGREVIEHSRPPTDAAAEAPEASCKEGDDEQPCDDHDVCSPRSVCRAGVCSGDNPFPTCVVADSAADFGDEQGKNGWYYGFWNASRDADGKFAPRDFEPMEHCADGSWRVAGRCGSSSSDRDHRWTMNLSSALQHPDLQADLELPVRRWVSDVSGPARITIGHHLGGGTGGDGTRAMLVIDGVEVWSHDAPGGDNVGVVDGIDVELREGTTLDQLVHPLLDQGEDMTYFSIKVEGR